MVGIHILTSMANNKQKINKLHTILVEKLVIYHSANNKIYRQNLRPKGVQFQVMSDFSERPQLTISASCSYFQPRGFPNGISSVTNDILPLGL